MLLFVDVFGKEIAGGREIAEGRTGGGIPFAPDMRVVGFAVIGADQEEPDIGIMSGVEGVGRSGAMRSLLEFAVLPHAVFHIGLAAAEPDIAYKDIP